MNVDVAYSLIIGAAMMTGWTISRVTPHQIAVEPRQRLAILAGAFCGAMIGAKLPYLFGDLEALLSGTAWFQNGKTILCGLVGGYLGVELAKWTLDIETKTGDWFAIPVAASISVGRLGCLHAQCCYGTATDLPWAMVFPKVDDVGRHPTQLYEAMFHLTAAIVLSVMLRRKLFQGNLIKLYIIAYATYRLVTEMIRPEPRIIGNLTAYQWASLAIILLFAGLWYRDRRRPVLAVAQSTG